MKIYLNNLKNDLSKISYAVNVRFHLNLKMIEIHSNLNWIHKHKNDQNSDFGLISPKLKTDLKYLRSEWISYPQKWVMLLMSDLRKYQILA